MQRGMRGKSDEERRGGGKVRLIPKVIWFWHGSKKKHRKVFQKKVPYAGSARYVGGWNGSQKTGVIIFKVESEGGDGTRKVSESS